MDHTLLCLLMICIVFALALLNRKLRADTKKDIGSVELTASERRRGFTSRAANVKRSFESSVRKATHSGALQSAKNHLLGR